MTLDFEAGHDKLWVPGTPQTKQRARKGKHGGWYTPRATVLAEQHIHELWVEAGGTLYEGPVELVVTFTADGTMIEVEPYLDIESSLTTDLDNLSKLVADGLNGAAYKDDKQIHRLVARKG